MLALYFDYVNLREAHQRYPSRRENFIVYGPSSQEIVRKARHLVGCGADTSRIESGGFFSIDTSLLGDKAFAIDWEHLRKVVNSKSGDDTKVLCAFINWQQFAALGDPETRAKTLNHYHFSAIPHLNEECRTVYLASKYDSLQSTVVEPIFVMLEHSFKDAITRFLKCDYCSACTDIWIATCDQLHSSRAIT